MKIFTKVFISVFCLMLAAVSLLSMVLVQYQISYATQKLVEENQIISNFLSKEIETGYFMSEWPYESLSELSRRSDFMFWWVVKEDGTIYRSDNVSFMGTLAGDYFPQAAATASAGSVYTSRDGKFAICFSGITLRTEKWKFWLGFSLGEIAGIISNILAVTLVVATAAFSVLAVLLFFAIKSYTNPINSLLRGTTEISNGNLDYRLKVRSRDELGELASQFNSMTEKLLKSRKELENYSKTLEDSVKKRTKELEEKNQEFERFNKLAVGRELAMIELKKRIAELERVPGRKKSK